MRVQGQLHKWVPGAAVMLSMTPDNVLARRSSVVFFIIRMKFKSLEPVIRSFQSRQSHQFQCAGISC